EHRVVERRMHFLGDERNSPCCFAAPERLKIDSRNDHPPYRWLQNAGDDPKQRRLTRTVRTEKADNRTAVRRERDIVQHAAAAARVRKRNAIDLKQRGLRRWRSGRWPDTRASPRIGDPER